MAQTGHGAIFESAQCASSINPLWPPLADSLAIYGVCFRLKPPTLKSGAKADSQSHPRHQMHFMYLFLCFDHDIYQKELTNEEDKPYRLRKKESSSIFVFFFADNAIFVAWGKLGAHKRCKNTCAKNLSQRGKGAYSRRGLIIQENTAIEYCQEGYFQSDTTCLEKWLYTNCV